MQACGDWWDAPTAGETEVCPQGLRAVWSWGAESPGLGPLPGGRGAMNISLEQPRAVGSHRFWQSDCWGRRWTRAARPTLRAVIYVSRWFCFLFLLSTVRYYLMPLQTLKLNILNKKQNMQLPILIWIFCIVLVLALCNMFSHSEWCLVFLS